MPELYFTTDLGKLWIKAGISIPLATSLHTGKKQLNALVLSKHRKMKIRNMGKETANDRSASGNSTISAE